MLKILDDIKNSFKFSHETSTIILKATFYILLTYSFIEFGLYVLMHFLYNAETINT